MSEPDRPATESAATRILVIDDAADVRLILRRALAKRGYDVSHADCGESGLKAVQADSNLDLILLDVMMPDIDGFEVCERLKADASTRDIPVIFLTGHDTPEMVVKGLEVGANDFVSKPIVLRTLLARVDVALRLRQAELEERRARRASEGAFKELAAARAEVQMAHRMTGLTVLAAGLAHELNSPLGALSTNLSFLGEELEMMAKGDVPDAETLTDCTDAVRESQESCQRLSAVVNRMRAYGEKARARSADRIDLSGVLGDLCQESSERHPVPWDVDCAPGLSVFGVEIELAEALGSIIDNGFVAAAANERRPAEIRIVVRDEIDHAEVLIMDSGEGIPEADLPFVFDPFFTRKQAWRSVGLGLGTALSILERHSGEIRIDGQGLLGGAAVTVRLPKKPARRLAARVAETTPLIPTLT